MMMMIKIMLLEIRFILGLIILFILLAIAVVYVYEKTSNFYEVLPNQAIEIAKVCNI